MGKSQEAETNIQNKAATYSLRQMILYFLKLGTIGFGGPVALTGYMYRDLVEKRRWISESDYKDGLALAQLAPGPLAAQLAIYLGYVHYRIIGATLVAFAFVAPSFLMVLALGWAYVHFGGLIWMQAVFYAVGASVIGIITFSAYKLTTKTIGKDWLLWTIFLVVGSVTVLTETENVMLFLVSGMLYWLVKAPPKGLWRKLSKFHSFVPLPATLFMTSVQGRDTGVLMVIFIFFFKGWSLRIWKWSCNCPFPLWRGG